MEVLYTQCEGMPLRGPNDLVFDSSGGFWFTDHGKTRPRDRDRGGLYYATTDGSDIREIAYPVVTPNGIGLSPDLDTLYWAETFSGRVFRRKVADAGVLEPFAQAPDEDHVLLGQEVVDDVEDLDLERLDPRAREDRVDGRAEPGLHRAQGEDPLVDLVAGCRGSGVQPGHVTVVERLTNCGTNVCHQPIHILDRFADQTMN